MLANNGVVTEDARKALERAVALDPNLIEPRLVLVIAKEQDGQFAAAVGGLARAAGERPGRCALAEIGGAAPRRG